MSDISVRKLVEEAENDFQGPYWQSVLPKNPPAQAELIEVAHRSYTAGYAIPVLTIDNSDGKLEFITERSGLSSQLFIKLTFEAADTATKSLFLNAYRTRIVCTHDLSVTTEIVRVITPNDLTEHKKYFFTIPEGDSRDNCRLYPYRPANQCPNCSVEYNSTQGVTLGSHDFRFAIKHIKDIPLARSN